MKRLLLTVIFLSLLSNIAAAQNLTVVTSTFKPYAMEEKGRITGIGTEIVQATLEKAGIKTEFQLYPWVRAYKMASDIPHILKNQWDMRGE